MSYWKQKRQLDLNKFNGRCAENRNLALDIMFKGVKVVKTHKGGDFEVTKHSSVFNNKGINNVEDKWVTEVKNGNAKLSKAQKSNQKKLGKGFKVKRYDF